MKDIIPLNSDIISDVDETSDPIDESVYKFSLNKMVTREMTPANWDSRCLLFSETPQQKCV